MSNYKYGRNVHLNCACCKALSPLAASDEKRLVRRARESGWKTKRITVGPGWRGVDVKRQFHFCEECWKEGRTTLWHTQNRWVRPTPPPADAHEAAQQVLVRWPTARVGMAPKGHVIVNREGGDVIGSGATRGEAWIAAATGGL